MNLVSTCPDCGNALSEKMKRCSCGWINTTSQEHVVADHRCRYVNQQRRCPLPGTMSISTHGGGNWYCSGHWRTLCDAKLAEAVLIDAEKNHETLLNARREWRRKLWE